MCSLSDIWKCRRPWCVVSVDAPRPLSGQCGDIWSYLLLFYAEQEIVFLSFLHKYVFAVEEQAGSGGGIDVAHFFLVDGKSSLLREFAQFGL